MRYIPNRSESDLKRCLTALGIERLDELFRSIPEKIRLKRPLNIPGPLDETSLVRHLEEISEANLGASGFTSFLGAGAYNHFIPRAVDHLLLRSEFFTSYTPYQPEISQGNLQAMFEFQTMVCELTGMEVANASMYDGASALAEALLMAGRITGRPRAVVARAVHPEYRQVCRTYFEGGERKITEVETGPRGTTEPAAAESMVGDDTACLAVQYPNFFGCIEELVELSEVAHKAGALLVVAVAEPIALGLLTPPGLLGADIVAGEGQALGIPLSFGGPYLGLMAGRKKHVRNMPGRIVGETVDVNGRRGYVLTLSTREQHIRRETATSNICTNEGLCALAATITMSLLGREGFRELSLLNYAKASYAKKTLTEGGRVRLKYPSPVFNEFVVELPGTAEEEHQRLQSRGIVAGLPLGRFYPELSHCLLLCTTEMNLKQDIDRLGEMLKDKG